MSDDPLSDTESCASSVQMASHEILYFDATIRRALNGGFNHVPMYPSLAALKKEPAGRLAR
jgi:hypothetical protein